MKVAVVQMNASAEKAENVRRAAAFVEEAAGQGAEVVALPELFVFLGDEAQKPAQAEPIPGTTSDRMADLARRFGITLLAGSILERGEVEGKCYNTSLLFGPNGDRLARYRKIHLFDVAVGSERHCESDVILPGREIVTVETAFGPVGLAICYDLRFPELFRELRRRDVRLIFLPSAFTRLTGEAHWEVLVRARAIENQVFVVAPDQVGGDAVGREYFGHSLIVDPWGRILAEVAEGEGIALAEIDFAEQDRLRREMPVDEHRRLQGRSPHGSGVAEAGERPGPTAEADTR